jgi:alkaline phosphatase
MKRLTLIFLLLALPAFSADRPAKNVILFIGDAAGLPTVNAASIYAYNEPHKLFIQNMPHIGLMDTSAASNWVTDSAAGMTAIVTGHKTHNGVISQGVDAVRGKKDGTQLKTILEYAEERGLSTGVVSDRPIVDATPAACYAHVNDRRKAGEIFLQALRPAYGDGVDVAIGPGRQAIFEGTRKLGVDLEAEMKAKGRPLLSSVDEIPRDARRAVVLLENSNFDLALATQRAIEALSRNPKGFFLMVELDCHADDIVKGLESMVALDNLVRRTVERVQNQDTLVIFAADHSYDLRVSTGTPKDRPLISDADKASPPADGESVRLGGIRRDGHHTAEQVLVSAQGPGAERVRGFFLNTDLFRIMMAAYGW